MFSFLKRSSKASHDEDFSDTSPLCLLGPVARATPTAIAALPAAEMVEGNQEADWAAWEDSVAFQDSQFPADLFAVESRSSTPSKPTHDIQDAFASVGKYAP